MAEKDETWEQRKKRLLEEVGMTTVPLGGFANTTPYERRHGLRKR